MKNIGYDGYEGPRLPQDQQLRRLRRVMDAELTEKQYRVVVGYYLEHRNMVELADELGVNKSTVCRTLKRAEARMRRCLKY